MKIILSTLTLALIAFTASAQERTKPKADARKATAVRDVAKEAPKETKKMESKKESLDINFRGHEQRVRRSIYTLGGRLTLPGEKPGDGC